MPHQCTSCGRAFADGSKEMLSGCPECGGNKFQFMPEGAIEGNESGETGRRAATAAKKAPEEARPADSDAPETGGDPSDGATGRTSASPETGRDSRASAVNRAAATVRDWVGRGDDADRGGSDATDAAGSGDRTGGDESISETPPAPSEPAREDSAQASARSDVVSKSELPDDLPEAGPSIQRTPRSVEDDTQSSADAPSTQPSAEAPDAQPSPDAPDSQAAPEADDDANVVGVPDDRNPGLKELREELNSQFESIRIVNPGQYELNLMELYEREEYIISLQEDGKYVIEVPDAWDAVER